MPGAENTGPAVLGGLLPRLGLDRSEQRAALAAQRPGGACGGRGAGGGGMGSLQTGAAPAERPFAKALAHPVFHRLCPLRRCLFGHGLADGGGAHHGPGGGAAQPHRPFGRRALWSVERLLYHLQQQPGPGAGAGRLVLAGGAVRLCAGLFPHGRGPGHRAERAGAAGLGGPVLPAGPAGVQNQRRGGAGVPSLRGLRALLALQPLLLFRHPLHALRPVGAAGL